MSPGRWRREWQADTDTDTYRHIQTHMTGRRQYENDHDVECMHGQQNHKKSVMIGVLESKAMQGATAGLLPRPSKHGIHSLSLGIPFSMLY